MVRRRPAYPGHHPDRDVEPDGHRPRSGHHPSPRPFQRRRAAYEHRLVHSGRPRVHPHHVEGKNLLFLLYAVVVVMRSCCVVVLLFAVVVFLYAVVVRVEGKC